MFSCKKKNDQKSKMTLLTQKPWVYAKFEEKINTGVWTDDYPNWLSCEKDDQIIFRTNNTYEENEGATKCDPSDPQIISSGAWAFTNNETKITVNVEVTIDQLDENTLIVSSSEVYSGTTYYSRITFKH
jgi:hypothetical protein